ncbi:MAG: thiamine-binding protein, partial [Gammaproteobacteria bacterium]|nr:thiamine-binding protein [Gammaproteobacteria bacterium]
DVIGRLNTHDGIEVVTNPMATQVRGEYEDVMRVLTKEIGTTFEQVPKAVFTIRILNNPIED